MFNEINEDFIIQEGVLQKYTGASTAVRVPLGVQIIGEDAFRDRTDVQRVYIPESVTRIEAHAFAGSGLIDLVIPASVTFLGTCSFANCQDLTHVILESSGLQTGKGTFAGANADFKIEASCLHPKQIALLCSGI